MGVKELMSGKAVYEIEDGCPGVVFINGVGRRGSLVNGVFISENSDEGKGTPPEETEEERIVRTYHLAVKMRERFGDYGERKWWRIAEYEYNRLIGGKTNGKRRVRLND